MNFGIYAGSIAGSDTGLATGKPDDPAAIINALNDLQNADKLFLVRSYIHYTGEGKLSNTAPENIEQYVNENRKLNLVVCYRSENFDEKDWTDAIRKIIEKYQQHLYLIQIAEEPNLKTVFAGDGIFNNIEQALLTGVLAAKEAVTKYKLQTKIGFNAVPSFNPADNFWGIIGSKDFEAFRNAIDYVGIDFYPDVFRPVAPDGQPNDLTQSVINVLRYFRNVNLKAGNIDASIPLHITENGYPTSPGKTYQRQAEVIGKIIRTIYEVKDELNIRSYELFSLRDADTSNENMFYQFGILKDDYTPKPAFYTYQRLIKELE